MTDTDATTARQDDQQIEDQRERREVFPLEHPKLRSCWEVAAEEIEKEMR